MLQLWREKEDMPQLGPPEAIPPAVAIEAAAL